MERDLGVRNEDATYSEIKNCTMWSIGWQGTEPTLIEMTGRVAIEVLKESAWKLNNAWFIPDIFVENLISEKYTEPLEDPTSPNERKKTTYIPYRYYLGLGRHVNNKPDIPYAGCVWTDCTPSSDYSKFTLKKKQAIMNMIHAEEDFMLDGYRSQEEIGKNIAMLGEVLRKMNG